MAAPDGHAETPDSSGANRWLPVAPLQLLAAAGGAALAGTYALSWVDITGPTQERTDAATVSARELTLLPEVAVGVGAVVVLLSVIRWNRWTQLGVLVAGLLVTGLSLLLWFFLRSNERFIDVGGHTGPPDSFEPALGLLAALGLSLALVLVAFVALLGEFREELPEE